MDCRVKTVKTGNDEGDSESYTNSTPI